MAVCCFIVVLGLEAAGSIGSSVGFSQKGNLVIQIRKSVGTERPQILQASWRCMFIAMRWYYATHVVQELCATMKTYSRAIVRIYSYIFVQLYNIAVTSVGIPGK